jgi:hypothetical protein
LGLCPLGLVARLRASSEGRSILILPIELLEDSGRRGRSAPLFRADLLLTGVLFERQLDAWISFHNGPFHNLRCRLDDLGTLLPSESSARTSDVPLDIGAASVQKKGRPRH